MSRSFSASFLAARHAPKGFHQRLAAEDDGAEQLGDAVVQFEGHAPALVLLHLHHAVRQRPQQLPRSAGPPSGPSPPSRSRALNAHSIPGTNGDLHRHPSRRPQQQSLDLGAGLAGRAFRSGRSNARSSAERKRRRELPITCFSGHLTILAKHWLAIEYHLVGVRSAPPRSWIR
jgi:hypothetical protein